MKKVQKKVVIIGAGNMASAYLDVINHIPNLEVVGIYSKTISKAQTLANLYKIPNVCKGIEELYLKTNAHGAIITVNEMAAEKIIVDCLKFNWILMVEKPVGLNLTSSVRILDLVNANNRKVFVALNRRYYSSVETAISILENTQTHRVVSIIDQEDPVNARKLGRPKEVCEAWHFANSIHLIDLFYVFCRGRIQRIDNVIPKTKNSFFSHSCIFFDSGDIGVYHSIWNAPGPWSVAIETPTQRLELSPIEELNVQTYPLRSREIIPKDENDMLFKPGLLRQMKDFYNALNNDESNLVTMDNYINSVELTHNLYNVEKIIRGTKN